MDIRAEKVLQCLKILKPLCNLTYNPFNLFIISKKIKINYKF